MPSPASIRRATLADIPDLHDALQRYYAEGDVQHPDDESSLLATLDQRPYGFFLAQLPPPNHLAGCVLLRPLDLPHAAECKRLFVLPEHRGHHLAALLMDALEDAARAANLRYLYLDSKANFQTAIAMYRRRGYTDTLRYNQNPEATVFLRKDLATHPC